ncbi:sensory rhodopsin transducer [Phytoactinopolyspora alkaliphila]|uniref:Sensory rhodopsin transducer n=1 Tax=Phytoactinopolyspora alkaliphila TaxID=1783498 RepID=A0A6N9YQM1_9ACTN|nr:sensory rhodopsin transducer [Phytoactinopolyspora alkaliphila]NED97119.1 sensory rhodopsin transducer [Phytoactinopolyspora alkaliphila]
MLDTLPPVGATTWVVADGYIPPGSTGTNLETASHESVCILNAGPEPATVRLYIFFTDRDPYGPYVIEIPARRAHHQQINRLCEPSTVPVGVDYSMLLLADTPVVVQHTRLDSRQAENALMSTIAYPVDHSAGATRNSS